MTGSQSANVIYRSARPDKREAVIALWEACGLTRPWNDSVADFDLALSSPASTVLVADSGTSILGTAMIGHDGHRGGLYYLAVAPDHQRRGIGRALVATAEDWLRTRSVPKLNLLVRHENSAVSGFYAALGYTDQHCLSLGKRLDG